MESWFLAGSHPHDYEAGLDPTTAYLGKNSGYIQSIGEELKGFGTLMQMFNVPCRIHLPVCHFRSPRPLLVKNEGKIDQW